MKFIRFLFELSMLNYLGFTYTILYLSITYFTKKKVTPNGRMSGTAVLKDKTIVNIVAVWPMVYPRSNI